MASNIFQSALEYYTYVQMAAIDIIFTRTENDYLVECFELGINKKILDEIIKNEDLIENTFKKFGLRDISGIVVLILRLIYRISHAEYSIEKDLNTIG